MYAYIENNSIADVRAQLPSNFATVSNFPALTEAERNAYGWYEMTVIDPPFDPETQIKEGPADTWNGVTATRTYTVRGMNTGEQSSREKAVARDQIIRGMETVAVLLFQIIRTLNQKGVIAPTDFTPDVRSAYLTLKTFVEKIES